MASLRHVRGVGFSASLFCGVVLFGLGFVHAASPSANNIHPPGARQGTEVEIRITGQNLGDEPELLVYHPGITVKQCGPQLDKRSGKPSNNSVIAVLSIAPDCRPGIHAFRVRTASGLTPMPVLFSVGQLPETEEVEPNNDPATAQTVSLDTTITGIVQPEDIDYFAVEAKKGERLNVEVEAMRLGRTVFDPLVTISDADMKLIARSDDEAFAWHDGVVSIEVPKDGKYFIQIREIIFGGNGASNYRMHVGRFPRPTAVIPAGGKPGETLEVTFYGDATGPWKKKITVPKNPTFYSAMNPGDQRSSPLFAEDKLGRSPTPLIFRVNDLDNAVEMEPNDDPKGTVNVTKAPIAFNGIIERPGDVDCFEFPAVKGQVYDIRVQARSIRSPLDSIISLYRKSNGNAVTTNDDSGSPDSYIRFTCTNDDSYVVMIRDMLGRGGVNYSYRVEVTPVEPAVNFTVAEKVQYIDTVAYVPQGSRAAVMVIANRKDYGGEFTLDVKGLPKGVTYEAGPVAAGQTTFPLLLRADEKAPPAVGVLDVRPRASDEKYAGLNGHLSQTTKMFRVLNRSLLDHTIQGLSVGVVKKSPFEIEIVEPKVPLVRSGSMELKVRAVREPGFTGPINIRMLYNPPGTAASVSAKIDEGKDEGTLFINASNTAEMKPWKIVVLGSAAMPTGGNFEVASDFATLNVAEPYFDLAFKPASVEQGKELKFVIGVTNNVEFKGKAKLTLLGLPADATADPIEITQDATEAVFTVKTTSKALVGRHKSIMCNVVVMQNGEPINHTLGPGEIRIDPPSKQVAAVGK